MNDIVWTTEKIKLGDLVEWENNPVQLSKHDFEQIKISLDKFGLVLPLVANQPARKNGKRRLIDGHQRKTILVYSEMADTETVLDVRVPNRKLTERECDELSIRLRRNTGEFDFDVLANQFDAGDLLDWGFEEFELGMDAPVDYSEKGSLVDRFVVPPFTVLDARQGYWQDRKRQWFALGIEGEAGRAGSTEANPNLDAIWASVSPGHSPRPATKRGKDGHTVRGDGHGRDVTDAGGGTSVFDPVLAEILYRWFCPPGGLVINPTSGESVYGIVAGYLGYRYSGVELRKEQNDSNRAQWEVVKAGANPYIIDGGNGFDITAPTPDEVKLVDLLAKPHVADGRLQYLPMGAYKEAVEKNNIAWIKQNGTPIGFVLLSPKTRTNVLKIEQIAKHEAAPPGVGKALFSYAVERATEEKRAALQLEVRQDNNNAIGFYNHMGMNLIGEKGDNYLYELILNNPIAGTGALVDPVWLEGDGQNVYELVGEDADFILCCPPYHDLEIYSDDERDLSNMEYDEFITVYNNIIAASVKRLKDNRFAAFVVGDIRDKNGNYRNFVSHTIQAFIDAGCALYNEAVVVTAIGSLPLRVTKSFQAGRKLGKTHQNVLVFVKGDWRQAMKELPELEVGIGND